MARAYLMSGKLSSRTAWLPLAVLIICLAVWAAPIVAQGPGLAIDQASLRLWPEYDDPGLLVIFSGAFTGTATFPQKVAFPVPAGARGIQATVIAANGDLLSQPWQIVDGKLTYTLPEPAFQIEFYLDRPASSNRRDIGFTFETAYPIKNLAVSLQQPARATGFSATRSRSNHCRAATDSLTTRSIGPMWRPAPGCRSTCATPRTTRGFRSPRPGSTRPRRHPPPGRRALARHPAGCRSGCRSS